MAGFVKRILRQFKAVKRKEFPNFHVSATIPNDIQISNSHYLYMEERTSIGWGAVINNPYADVVFKKWAFCGPQLFVSTGNYMSVVGTPTINVTEAMKREMSNGGVNLWLLEKMYGLGQG